jgi:hypothetical protein
MIQVHKKLKYSFVRSFVSVLFYFIWEYDLYTYRKRRRVPPARQEVIEDAIRSQIRENTRRDRRLSAIFPFELFGKDKKKIDSTIIISNS